MNEKSIQFKFNLIFDQYFSGNWPKIKRITEQTVF